MDTLQLPANTLLSDADRNQATQLLTEAFQQGRLTDAEYEERATLALTARTVKQLREVLLHLPVTALTATGSRTSAPLGRGASRRMYPHTRPNSATLPAASPSSQIALFTSKFDNMNVLELAWMLICFSMAVGIIICLICT